MLAARGESAALVEGAGAGLAVAPEDPEALAAALRTLAADPSAGRGWALRAGRPSGERYARRASVDRWADLLERVAAQQALR